MSKYRRQKRVDAISHSPKKQLSINIGHVRYSFDILKSMCHDKSIQLTQSLELEIGEEVEVVFGPVVFLNLLAYLHLSKMSQDR